MADDEARPAPRREFLNFAIAGTATTLGVLGAYPVARFLATGAPPSARTARVGEESSFPRRSARTLLVGERPALVVRLGDGSFRAFVALCTHLHCVVHYSAERDRIECPCHRGVFAVDGTNLSGPPPRPLEPILVEVLDGIVTLREA